MPDAWLQKIQQPAQVDRLLEAFATRSGLLPPGAYRVRDRQALPETLRQHVTEDVEHVWMAFAHGATFWLFRGRLSVALSRERNAPVLWITGYGDNGVLIEAGAWTVDHDGKWQRCGDYVPM